MLLTDSSPNQEAFVKFSVSGLAAPVAEARLRLYAVNGTVNGPAVSSTQTTWTESGITWSARPAETSGVLDDLGTIPANTWADYDVSAAVTGNGTYSFRLAPASSDGVDFRSREGSGNTPRLVITHATADTSPPETSIDSGPSGTVGSTIAEFTFSANESNSSFACRLDGSVFGFCSSPRSYTAVAEGAHAFEVRAIDGAGNADASPASRTWTVDEVLFREDFETGDLSPWSLVQTGGDGIVSVQSSIVRDGAYAAKLSESSAADSFAYARKSFAEPQTDITVSGDFNVLVEGATSSGNVPLFRVLDSTGARLVSLYRQNLTANKVGVGYNGSNFTTTGNLPLSTWAKFSLHVVTAGAGASSVEVYMDGALIHRSTSANLGTSGVLTLQIGNDTKKQTFSLAADNIVARREIP